MGVAYCKVLTIVPFMTTFGIGLNTICYSIKHGPPIANTYCIASRNKSQERVFSHSEKHLTTVELQVHSNRNHHYFA